MPKFNRIDHLSDQFGCYMDDVMCTINSQKNRWPDFTINQLIQIAGIAIAESALDGFWEFVKDFDDLTLAIDSVASAIEDK